MLVLASLSTSSLIAWSLLVLLVAVMAWAGRRFFTALQMRNWPKVKALVTAAELRRGQKKGFEGCRLYDPLLRYQYSVAGQSYEGARYTHPAVSNAEVLTAQFITQLGNPGAEIDVYYHPQNPAEAVVQPLPWQGAAVVMAVAALLLSCWLWVV
jgi:hypothetical protein